MKLPRKMTEILDRLEARGYEAWVVGGCVRDSLLGIEPHDYDVCTSALPQQTQEVFSDCRLVLAGMKHGTIGVIADGDVVEITTFRTEGDYSDSRHPGWVQFVPTIGEDLSRRDFTVNAMAWSPLRGYADPFGGAQDLKNHVLRAVGDPNLRFEEDALRILRGIRFSARFHLEPEAQTEKAMLEQRGRLDDIARERVLEELTQFLCLADTDDFLRWAPIIAQAVPPLGESIGFQQHSPHHAYDVFTHTACVTAALPKDPVMRWTGLLHDVAKPACFSMDDIGRGHFAGHARRGAEMAGEILTALRAPNAMREEVSWLIGHHMDFYPAEEKTARRLLSRHGKDRMERLLTLQMADWGGKGVAVDEDIPNSLTALWNQLEELSQREGALSLKNLAVNGTDLMALGYPQNPNLGKTLHRLLDAVIGGALPNEKQALLRQAEKWRS